MGAKYTSKSATGYNASAPADDGSQAASNLITWAKHKEKLGDPVKTLADDINTALVAAFNYSVRQVTASDSLVAGDHMRCVELAPTVSSTVAVTLTLPDAATMTNVYRVYIKNSREAGVVTIARATGGDTIDGAAANITLPAGAGILLSTTTGASGYITVASVGYSSAGYKLNGLLDISGSSGGQIKFPATQNASSDANTLDDYEEGTWTPALAFGGASVGITYTARPARYVKIGTLVQIEFYMLLSSKGLSTGSPTISGLPFAADATSSLLVMAAGYAETLSSAGTLIAYISAGGSALALGFGDSTGFGVLADTNFGNTSEVGISMTYQAAS